MQHDSGKRRGATVRVPRAAHPGLWLVDPATGVLPRNTVALVAQTQGAIVAMDRGGRRLWYAVDYGDVVTGHFASIVPLDTSARCAALALRYEYHE